MTWQIQRAATHCVTGLGAFRLIPWIGLVLPVQCQDASPCMTNCSHQARSALLWTELLLPDLLTCRLRSCRALSFSSRSSLCAVAACSRRRCASASARSCARRSISARRCAVSVLLNACSSFLFRAGEGSRRHRGSETCRRKTEVMAQVCVGDLRMQLHTAALRCHCTASSTSSALSQLPACC